MTWDEAKEIRKQYPRQLTDTHIQEILDKWGIPEGDDHMFSFSCSHKTDGSFNLSELKLWLLFNNKCHIEEIKSYNTNFHHPLLQKSHGNMIAIWCGHIIDGGEYKKSTQPLRLKMMKQLLNEWKENSIFFEAQKEGVQNILNIKKETRAKYPALIAGQPWTEKCYRTIQKFINE